MNRVPSRRMVLGQLRCVAARRTVKWFFETMIERFGTFPRACETLQVCEAIAVALTFLNLSWHYAIQFWR